MRAQMWLVFLLPLIPLVNAVQSHELGYLLNDFIRRESRCYQDTPNCNDCLTKPDCSWCSNGVATQCTSSTLCPKESISNQCSDPKTASDNSYGENPDLIRELLSFSSLGDDARNVSCLDRKNCSFCTTSSSCFWCETKRKCLQYSNPETARNSCGSDLWYKNQCVYKSTIKPCPERTAGCKECTQDKVCFWCKSSGNCSFYPYDAYVPPDCPRDNWYYDTCTRMEFWVVLAPILAILLAPILIFLIIAIILWWMKKFHGKDVEDDDEADDEDGGSSQASPLPEKKMVLSHRPEPSRVEELRQKYNLGD